MRDYSRNRPLAQVRAHQRDSDGTPSGSWRLQ